MKVRKAIIPAAGLGTRVLPASKAIPKEMLNIVDKPAIQYIVEEAFNSGIEEVLIITNRGKGAIEDHFDHAYELESKLKDNEGKKDIYNDVLACSKFGNIFFIRQKETKGLGHAVLCAKSFVGNEPFAVLYGDDVINYSILGRVVLPPEIFDILEKTPLGAGNELQLTDAMKTLAQNQGVIAVDYEGKRYDMGNKFGILQANIEVGLKHPDTRDELKAYLKELAKNF